MAKNTGNNYRKGTVRDRSQTYNPKTERYIERDTNTGKFINQKSEPNSPFKGVRKED